MFDDLPHKATRRIPVYLLIETSGAMANGRLQAVNQGIRLLHRELVNNPDSLDMVHLGLITFDTGARVVVPLTDVSHFAPPTLNAGGASCLPDALDVLRQALEQDIRPNTTSRKGDYKPLVFIFVGGLPTDKQGKRTDSWREGLHRLQGKSETNEVRCSMIVLGIGADQEMDDRLIRELGHVALRMRDVTPGALHAFFQWISAAVNIASAHASKQAEIGPVNAPPLPSEAMIQLI